MSGVIARSVASRFLIPRKSMPHAMATENYPEQPKDPNHVATYVLARAEAEKSDLARTLHDDIGGLIVGALMDVAWVEGHINEPVAALAKLQRARQSLRTAVDMKRNLIEQLRPTLLENIGLFAALKWHIEKLADVSAIECSFQLSKEEPTLPAESAITLFRIVQEAVRLMVNRLGATSIELAAHTEAAHTHPAQADAVLDGPRLLISLSYDSASLNPIGKEQLTEFATLLHQIATLQGTFKLTQHAPHGASWEIEIPTAESKHDWPRPQ
jgi:glucose-6-phosphate-specific signal transduction histidine kinase